MSNEPAFNGFMLSVTAKGVMRLSTALRESYLDPQTNGSRCITHAVGHHLNVWLPSDGHAVRLELALDGFHVRRPYEQKVHRWGVNINRYLDSPEGSVTTREGRDGPVVDAEVHVVEEGM